MNEFTYLAEAWRQDQSQPNLHALALRLATTPCGPLHLKHISPDRELAALLRSIADASPDRERSPGPGRERIAVRQRALIHVDGPPGAGKTTLVEALLTHTDHMITAMRCVRDDTLPEPRESLAKTDPERAAIGQPARTPPPCTPSPPPATPHDAFFQTNFMQDFSHAVMIEGDCPVSFARRHRLRRASHRWTAPGPPARATSRAGSGRPWTRWRRCSANPAAWSRYSPDSSVPAWASSALPQPELVEQERRKALAQLAELRSRPVAKHRMRWAVADTYRGIERAQLVVVNIHDHTEKDNGEALLPRWPDYAKTTRSSPTSWARAATESPSTPSSPTSPPPTDPGTKKALARIRRVIRPNG